MNEPSNTEWYTDKLYSKSIYETIATAIADCMICQAEFNQAREKVARNHVYNTELQSEYCSKLNELVEKAKNGGLTLEELKSNSPKVPEYKLETVIVEFDAKPTDIKYTDENWNAVVLWNYLAEAIWGFLYRGQHGDGEQCIDEVGNTIKTYYKNIDGIDGHINKAVSDIKEYAKALNLYNYVYRLREWIKDREERRLYKSIGYTIDQNKYFDLETKSGEFCLDDVNLKIDGKVQRTTVNLRIQNGEVTEYQTSYGVYTKMDSDMTMSGKKTIDTIKFSTNKDLTQTKYPEDVHSLTNFSTCHIDSLITALSMSDLFRKAIKSVADMPTKTFQLGKTKVELKLCKMLNAMINAIDSGAMSVARQGGSTRYKEAYDRLKDALAQTRGFMEYKRGINNQSYVSNNGNVANNNGDEQELISLIKLNADASSIESGGGVVAMIIQNILQAVSYELMIYDKYDPLYGSLIDIYKNMKSQFIDVQPRPSSNIGSITFSGKHYNNNPKPIEQYIQAEINDLTVVNKGVWVQTGDTINGNTPAITDEIQQQINKIVILPDVMCVLHPASIANSTLDLDRQKYIMLKDIYGEKKYRLVSEIAHYGYHYVANVRINDKYYVVDDMQGRTDHAIKETYYDTEFKINQSPRKTFVSIYERCD
ncbi:MAG: hypothetical protein IJS10_02315 [Alphaproteobacteria bacterium]|nr:hypothetical protein [Alphaproteobacteria bacterium]